MFTPIRTLLIISICVFNGSVFGMHTALRSSLPRTITALTAHKTLAYTINPYIQSKVSSTQRSRSAAVHTPALPFFSSLVHKKRTAEMYLKLLEDIGKNHPIVPWSINYLCEKQCTLNGDIFFNHDDNAAPQLTARLGVYGPWKVTAGKAACSDDHIHINCRATMGKDVLFDVVATLKLNPANGKIYEITDTWTPILQ